MRRSIITVGIVAALMGVPTLAGEEHLAFDSMGSMMLEHEAEENIDGASLSSVPRYEQEAQCEEKEAQLRARLEGLRLELAEGMLYSANTLEDISLTALDLAEVKVEQVLGHMDMLRGEELETLRKTLEEHRVEIESHRDVLDSIADQKLFSTVQEALGKAQEALAAN